MRISLLGPVVVRDDADRVVETGGAKQRAVLAQLCREPNRAVGVDRLAEGVWGEQVPERYRQNLQVYVSTWRRALDAGRPRGVPSRIVGHRDAYELVAGPDEIDTVRFATRAANGHEALADGRPEHAATELTAALAEWRGDPLADLVDQPFAGDWISELESARLETLEARIQADLARGQDAGLSPELDALVHRYPERERFWHQLALSLYRAGRQTDALATLDEARNRLLDELGLDPSPMLQQLQTDVLNHDPSLLATAPAVLAAALPVPLAACLGRDDLTAGLAGQLVAGERLITLHGPGGAGKTRLSLAVGHALAAAGRTVVWVALADHTDADLVPELIAAAAGFPGARQFGDAAAEARPVVILDNLEQLPGIGSVVRRVLEEAPGAQILATSRSPLLVPGERLVELPPLADDDATTLFVERARAAAPGVDLTGRHEDIVTICRLLDGLPLAVELVAAQTRNYDLAELADELRAGSDPSHSTADGGRHSSVRNAVRWSLGLLGPADQDAFARLSVLVGTFDRATAVAVVRARESINRLLHAGLLQPVETTAGRRFRMLTTIRAAATELLDDPTGATEALIAHRAARLTAIDPMANLATRALAVTEDDLPSTERVIELLVSTGRWSKAASLVIALVRPLVQARRSHDLRRLAERVRPGLADLDRARIDVATGAAAYMMHDPAAAPLLDAVERLTSQDTALQLIGLNYRCVLRADSGDSDGAAADAAAGVEAARAIGRSQPIARSLSAASWAAIRRGDFAAAVEFAIEQREHVDDPTGQAAAWSDLCLAQLFAQDLDGARESATKAVELGYQLGTGRHLAEALKLLASVRLQDADAEGAASLLAAAIEMQPEQADEGWLLEAVAQVGLSLVLAGQTEAGDELVRRAGGLARRRFGVDDAVPDFDVVVAERLGIRPGRPIDDPEETLAGLLTRATDLARALAA